MRAPAEDTELNQADWPWGEAEFQAFFLDQFEGLYRFLYRMVGSQPEAEDLAQEAFLRFSQEVSVRRSARDPEHRPQGDFEEGGSPRAWLYRVGSNLALNFIRDAKRLRSRHERAGRLDLVRENPERSPAETYERESDRRRVRQVLAGLSVRQSRILLLRHSGLSYQELAEVLAVSPHSVGTLIARAEAAFAAAYAAAYARSGQGN